MQATPSKAKEGQPAQPTKPDHNEAIRLLAHQRLEQLFQEALASNFYGRIVIEVAFIRGRPETVHRRIEGTDKPNG